VTWPGKCLPGGLRAKVTMTCIYMLWQFEGLHPLLITSYILHKRMQGGCASDNIIYVIIIVSISTILNHQFQRTCRVIFFFINTSLKFYESTRCPMHFSVPAPSRPKPSSSSTSLPVPSLPTPPLPRLRSSRSPRDLPPHFADPPIACPRPPSPRRLRHASITVELATGPRASKISQPLQSP
jgi:hypothetical protein